MPTRAGNAIIAITLTFCVFAQQPVPPPGFGPRVVAPHEKDAAERAKTQPAPVAPAKPAAPAGGQTAKPEAAGEGAAPVFPAGEPGTAQATAEQPVAAGDFVLNLQNANLLEVIDILARRLKINYILDPRVKGGVTINTYGELKEVDLRALLETILRINGAAMVPVGSIYRIVPVADAVRLPISPTTNAAELPEDERLILNLVFLKYMTVADVAKLLDPFRGEGSTIVTYEPANLLLILDNSRNMRRTMELVAMLDNETFVQQRVRTFTVKNLRPSDLAGELEAIQKQIAFSEKTGAVRFLPLDRINLLVAIAPNPGVFEDVARWIEKLDVAVAVAAGAVDNYVYRVKYQRAEMLAMSISQLYGVDTGLGMFGWGGLGLGMGMMGFGGGFNRAMRGGAMGAMGGAWGGGMLGGGMFGGGLYGGGMYGGYPMNFPLTSGSLPVQAGGPVVMPSAPQAGGAAQTAAGAGSTGRNLTGSYLGSAAPASRERTGPRVVPNFMDNSLLIQATPQEYEGILKLLRQLDVPPRQVLIEAKIYEVSLTGAFAGGVQAALRRREAAAGGANDPLGGVNRQFLGAYGGSGMTLTAGMLLGDTRQLLGLLTATESNTQSKLISAPTLIATDSIPASINVGQEVPILTSQALSPVQQGGSSLFTNTVAQRNAGVTLNIVAMINPSGVVTLMIDQEVSAPQAPAADAAIQSPSFSTRNVSTQVTVQDGDTIAIGGIIQETNTNSTSGVPYLNRIPGVGMLFGARSRSQARTELVVFLTPRVIYDTNAVVDATNEFKNQLQRINKMIRE